MQQAVAYLRVSTSEQKKSGLGLEAQKSAIKAFAEREGLELVGTYRETQTGKGSDALDRRPRLAAALRKAKKLNCPIIVAKLDRLSRDVHFISGLMAERVEFIVSELGRQADPFILHLFAALAEKERSLISQRTREGLQEARKRGVLLGMAGKSKEKVRSIARSGGKAAKVQADEWVSKEGWAIETAYQDAGTYLGAAKLLNERGIKSARGGQWYAATVKSSLARLEAMS